MAAYPTRGARLPIVVAAALVAGAVLWPFPASAACGGGPSAVNVYKECVPTGSGGKPTSSSRSTHPTLSPQATKALEHAGKDRRRLAGLLQGYGATHLSEPGGSNTAAAEPGAVESAFDLDSGPTALLIVLAGTAALLLGGSGLRAWRYRHHT